MSLTTVTGDICDLAELLVEAKAQRSDPADQVVLNELLQRYERVMLLRAREMLARSAETGRSMEAMPGGKKVTELGKEGVSVTEKTLV